MANDKEVTASNGDKIKVTKGIKDIKTLNDTSNILLSKLKAFPLARSNKQNDELDALRNEINDTIDVETNRIISKDVNASGRELAMFLNNLFTKNPNENKGIGARNIFQSQSLEDLMNDQNAQLNLILSERYKNINSLYEDIRLVTEQISELAEVVDTFRDSIVNADNLITDISRVLKFDNNSKSDNLMETVKTMEDETRIKEKLKKTIIPEALKYGNSFVFSQPYKDLFAKFKAMDDKYKLSNPAGITSPSIDKVVGESFTPTTKDTEEVYALFESFKPDFEFANKQMKMEDPNYKGKEFTKESFEALVEQYISENISVINDPMVPLLEDAEISTLAYPDVRASVEKAIKAKKADKNWKPIRSDNVPRYSDGVLSVAGAKTSQIKAEDQYVKEYHDITGVYTKIYDPRKVFPIYTMDYCIGYYLMYETMQETTTNVLNAVHTLSRTTMLFQNDKKREFESKFVGLIADRICKSIDKPFLKNNKQFRELIANAISYDNFYTKNFRVQFVTSNYITHFKINEDYNTHMGTSILYRSMFYAMLYLTTLLFYILMYVTRSGDTRMFLIKGNGADQDVSGKMNRIIKEFKENQINYNDFGSVRGILSKVGRGKDIGVPVGMNGDRAFDIEQLPGTSIDFNDPLIELLRKNMISSTGCPSAMLNYLDEVDFAKQIQMLHSKFVSRCVTMQEETEEPITDLYRKLLSYGDYNISDDDIASFRFEWSRPKTLNTANMGDLISSADQLAEFIVKVFEGDNSINTPRLKDRIFSHVVREYIMKGTFDWDAIEKDLRSISLDLRNDILEEEANKIKTEEG